MDQCLHILRLFRVGVGPSSSHTLGPWKAADEFAKVLRQKVAQKNGNIQRIEVHLYGSLAKTGRGHGTDKAVVWGLSGLDPEISTRAERADCLELMNSGAIAPSNVACLPKADVLFHHDESLDYHPNGMRFSAFDSEGSLILEQIRFSVGGGIVAKATGERIQSLWSLNLLGVNTAADAVRLAESEGSAFHEWLWAQEVRRVGSDVLDLYVDKIWSTMRRCMQSGLAGEGTLPGGLGVVRRARGLFRFLCGSLDLDHTVTASGDAYGDLWGKLVRRGWSFSEVNDWVACLALAVNEENASFGRVVTAPTNGAAGVIPAVLAYGCFLGGGVRQEQVRDFLVTAAFVGHLFREKATISAAQGGCQAEIGVASSMAAAGLATCLGATAAQSMVAAEIAMEHHLGMTCDPVGGLVQVPCIERNTMGAIKAIAAAQLALRSNPGEARVSLDDVIHTMWTTAQDMDAKYKETAEGGLAVRIPVNLVEC